MANDIVIIKGVRDGMLILMDDSAPWDKVLGDLRSRLEERSSFFRGASVTINLGDRIIDQPEWNGLYDLLQDHEIELYVLVSSSTQSRAVAAAQGVRNRAPAFAGRHENTPELVEAQPVHELVGASNGSRGRGKSVYVEERPVAPAEPELATLPPEEGEPDFLAIATDPEDPEPEQNNGYGHFGWEQEPAGALFLRRTLRSGMSVHHDGDVCILGDVNAGAEIVAGGDVLVWGILRGLVHAGAGGDNAAVVGALLLAPTQLRIGDVLSRGPAETPAPNGRPIPEMARIEGDRIVVEMWSLRRR